MNVSLFKAALDLRDEAREAQLAVSSPDFSELAQRGGERGGAKLPELPGRKFVVDLMRRAQKLRSEADKGSDAGDQNAAALVTALLEAASAPLFTGNESTTGPSVVRPPTRPEPHVTVAAPAPAVTPPRPAPAKAKTTGKQPTPKRKKGK